VERLRNDVAAEAPRALGGFVDVETNLSALARRISEMCAAERVGGGRIQLRLGDIALGAVAGEVATELAPLAEDRGRVIRPSGHVTLRADADLVRRAMQNAVAYALRASDGGAVQVATGVAEDGFAFVRVRWSAASVRPEARTAIEGADTEAVVGAAIGLAFCRLVAEEHAGRITLDALDGTVTLDLGLPLGLALPTPAPTPEPEAAVPPRPPAPAAPPAAVSEAACDLSTQPFRMARPTAA
jgi:signal transduction histidine kinase